MIRILAAIIIASALFAGSGSDFTGIRGVVTHSETGAPLTGVTVKAEGPDTTYTALTDRSGRFSIPLEPGLYNVYFSYFAINDKIMDSVDVSGPTEIKAGILPDFRPEWLAISETKKEIESRKSDSDTIDSATLREYKTLTRKFPSRPPFTEIARRAAYDGRKKVGASEASKSSEKVISADGLDVEEFSDSYVVKGSRHKPKAEAIEVAGEAYGSGGSGAEAPSTASSPVLKGGSSMELGAASSESGLERGGSYSSAATPGIDSDLAGVLTSGEVNDFRKWDFWLDINEGELSQYRDDWSFNPTGRHTVQLLTADGMPAIDRAVQLMSAQGSVIWESRTDNTGKAELWANIFEGDNFRTEELNVFVKLGGGKDREITNITEFHDGLNSLVLNEYCSAPENADIAFVVDATGSMGDEIDYLKAELSDIMGKLKEKYSKVNFNLGSIFYRDLRDDYIIRKSGFSKDISNTVDFIRNNGAAGGGDYPEAVDLALQAAVNDMQWSETAVARIIFLILDAPPHKTPETRERLKEISAKASMLGIRIVPVTCSGVDKSTEYLMRSLALSTNGTYVFLTDHSGVGGSHIEPTTGKYDVELLNELFIRLIGQFTITPECDSEMPLAGADSVKIEIFGKDENRPGDDVDIVSQVKCFPNPTSGALNIESKGGIEEIYLVDIAGKIIERFNLAGRGKMYAELSKYPTGIYFLKYRIKTFWGSQKILLMK